MRSKRERFDLHPVDDNACYVIEPLVKVEPEVKKRDVKSDSRFVTTLQINLRSYASEVLRKALIYEDTDRRFVENQIDWVQASFIEDCSIFSSAQFEDKWLWGALDRAKETIERIVNKYDSKDTSDKAEEVL